VLYCAVATQLVFSSNMATENYGINIYQRRNIQACVYLFLVLTWFAVKHCVNVLISFLDIKHSLTFITIRSLFCVRYCKNRSPPQQFTCVFSEQTPISFLYGINRLVFITETVCGNIRHELNT